LGVGVPSGGAAKVSRCRQRLMGEQDRTNGLYSFLLACLGFWALTRGLAPRKLGARRPALGEAMVFRGIQYYQEGHELVWMPAGRLRAAPMERPISVGAAQMRYSWPGANAPGHPPLRDGNNPCPGTRPTPRSPPAPDKVNPHIRVSAVRLAACTAPTCKAGPLRGAWPALQTDARAGYCPPLGKGRWAGR